MYGIWAKAARHGTQTATVQPFLRVLPPPAADPTPRYCVNDRIETERGRAVIKGCLIMRPKGDGRLESFKEPTVYYDVIFNSGQWWLISETDLVEEVEMWAQDTAANLSPVPTRLPAA